MKLIKSQENTIACVWFYNAMMIDNDYAKLLQDVTEYQFKITNIDLILILVHKL